ncbi:MAG: Maf family nucleotide pyrophosphatase [Gammaproteobacteria bacterium]|nr:Maf family nucleotide pyrophosphatase [Gammaproteobacteria bacterium]
MPQLVLASTSKYRKGLLDRLGIPFDMVSPGVDETPQADETPTDLALRLARQKALAVAEDHPESVIIGSDQVASFDGKSLSKPLTRDKALAQLKMLSGKSVEFHSALCVYTASAGKAQVELETTIVHFKTLTEQEILSYIEKEPSFDCVGAFKSESLGICLCERIENNDPTALVGLPLIRLSRMLKQAGIDIL